MSHYCWECNKPISEVQATNRGLCIDCMRKESDKRIKASTLDFAKELVAAGVYPPERVFDCAKDLATEAERRGLLT